MCNVRHLGKKRVNLSETTTIVIPWKLVSMGNAIINIAKNGFKYKDKMIKYS